MILAPVAYMLDNHRYWQANNYFMLPFGGKVGRLHLIFMSKQMLIQTRFDRITDKGGSGGVGVAEIKNLRAQVTNRCQNCLQVLRSC